MNNEERLQIAVTLREEQENKRQRTVPLARHTPPSPKERQRELEAIAEQSYDQLDGEWLQWLDVAQKYEHKVMAQDRLDIRHDIIVELQHARERDGKPLPILRAYRIASLTVALYWRQLKRLPFTVSLDSEVDDGEGNTVALKETVADDKAIDLEAWLDEVTWRLGCPLRLVQIAKKKLGGIPLTKTEARYLERFRRREQKSLF